MAKCPNCDRERVETMEAFWKNPSYSCPADVPRVGCNDSNWLELYCTQGKVSKLEAALAERDSAIASHLAAFNRHHELTGQLRGRIAELEDALERMMASRGAKGPSATTCGLELPQRAQKMTR